MRPTTLADVVGQGHLLGSGSPLRRLVEGQSGLGHSVWAAGHRQDHPASLISQATGRRFEALSAPTAGVRRFGPSLTSPVGPCCAGEQTVLFIDEVHRFSKTQQDALLAAVENRIVLLVAATTENPSFSVVAPLLSRSLILQLHTLGADDIRAVVHRAVADPRGLGGAVQVDDDAVELLVQLSAGDARRALTALEVAAETAAASGGRVTVEAVEQSLDRAAVRYDRDGDQHYDVVSAFIKSIRGSDVDAALHYLARMLAAGEDPRFVARRLMILASEGHRDGRSERAAVGGRGGADRGAHRYAGGSADAGACHRAPGDGSEVQQCYYGTGVRRWPTSGREGRSGSGPPAGRTLFGGRLGWQRGATDILTTTRTELWPNSIRRTVSSAPTTTGRPVMALNGRSPTGWTNSRHHPPHALRVLARPAQRVLRSKQLSPLVTKKSKVCSITRSTGALLR